MCIKTDRTHFSRLNGCLLDYGSKEKEKGERKMNKIITVAAILSLALVASMVLTPTVIAMPGIKRLMDFYIATIQGGSPQTVDYSWAYDTASGEIIFNTMDTLIMFNESHTDQYIRNIAASWSIVNLPGGLDSGIPINGLTFENPANQTGTAKYYYRYIFDLNTIHPNLLPDFPERHTRLPVDGTGCCVQLPAHAGPRQAQRPKLDAV